MTPIIIRIKKEQQEILESLICKGKTVIVK